MIKNYLLIAIRNSLKYKGYSFINVFGLAVGMACFFLITLFIIDELSYDKFHSHYIRIYRVVLNARLAGKDFSGSVTCAPLAQTLMAEVPEVEQAIRLYRAGNFTVRYNENIFNEERFFHVDGNVFDVFTLPLSSGDPKTALTEPNTIVFSESMAIKYFGTEPALGKVVKVDGRTDYKITGIMRDVPSQSHIHFDFLASFNSRDESRQSVWLENSLYTYVLLKSGSSNLEFTGKLQGLVRKYVGPQIQQIAKISLEQFEASGGKYEYASQPLTDIHLNSYQENEVQPQGRVQYIYIFSVIALFILAIACINFMNLTTARSAGRAKEVGVRKVLGSERKELMSLFLVESLIMSFSALLLAVVITELSLTGFNALVGKNLNIEYFESAWILPSLVTLGFLVGLLSGSYPAFYLSAFQPISVLKGTLSAGMKSGRLRNVLVISQFTISIVLIIGTMVVYKQIEYMKNQNLGFEKEHTLVLPNAWQAFDNRQTFRDEIQRIPGVLSAGLANSYPGYDIGNTAFQPEGSTEDQQFLMTQFRTDFHFIETLGLEITNGRALSKEFSTDSSAIILNESAVRAMGLQNPVGKRVLRFGSGFYTIVGVVKDFNYESLHQPVKPAAIWIEGGGSILGIRLKSGNPAEVIASVEKVWNKFAPGEPFVYSFLDDEFDNLYRNEERAGTIVTVFSFLAIFIGCLGLLGLAAFSTERRTKEIGVRKVLGATETDIVVMIGREFAKLVLIAILVAAPLAYIGLSRWLEAFAYRVELDFMTFLFAGSMALFIALLTVSYQAVRAALSNPVKSLKYE